MTTTNSLANTIPVFFTQDSHHNIDLSKVIFFLHLVNRLNIKEGNSLLFQNRIVCNNVISLGKKVDTFNLLDLFLHDIS